MEAPSPRVPPVTRATRGVASAITSGPSFLVRPHRGMQFWSVETLVLFVQRELERKPGGGLDLAIERALRRSYGMAGQSGQTTCQRQRLRQEVLARQDSVDQPEA